MEIQISSRNYNISNKLKEILQKKVDKLERYFSEDAEVKIVCKKENDLLKLELTIQDKGLLFRSEVSSDNMYQNIDMALPKIEKQIIKYSSKLKDKIKKPAINDRDWLYFEEDDTNFIPQAKNAVNKIKSFDIVPLSVEDAQMYLENSDHAFYVYLNEETNKVNIIYKRTFGGYGIIEPRY